MEVNDKFEDFLFDQLKDPDFAVEYLKSSLDELDEHKNVSLLLRAFEDVARVQGDLSVFFKQHNIKTDAAIHAFGKTYKLDFLGFVDSFRFQKQA